jgi:hypothetical protein
MKHNKLKQHLDDYFNDWNLTESEKKELSEHINVLENNLNYIYDMVEVVKLSKNNEDIFMETIDKLIQEADENVKKDT